MKDLIDRLEEVKMKLPFKKGERVDVDGFKGKVVKSEMDKHGNYEYEIEFDVKVTVSSSSINSGYDGDDWKFKRTAMSNLENNVTQYLKRGDLPPADDWRGVHIKVKR